MEAYLGCAEEGRDSGSVSEGGPDNLGGVDDAGGDHVDHLLVGGVETLVNVGALLDVVNHHGGVQTSIVSNCVQRPGERILDNIHSLLLVLILGCDGINSWQTSGKGLKDYGGHFQIFKKFPT